MKRRARFYCNQPGCRLQWKNVHTKACRACKQPNRERSRVKQGEPAYVLPDIPEHFQPAFGEVVTGRRHMRRLQEKHGTKDWEPVQKGTPVTDMLKRVGRQGDFPR